MALEKECVDIQDDHAQFEERSSMTLASTDRGTFSLVTSIERMRAELAEV